MQAASFKKAVKVSYQGETKRLKLSGSYQELVERTRTAFKALPQEFKFFYLDEDNEIISISSQSDFTEALEIEDLAALRLTVAQNAADARQQLVNQLEDSRPLAESLNNSVIVSQNNGGNIFGRTSTIQDQFMADSDFDAVSHAELAQSIVDRRNTMEDMSAYKVSHEMATGSDLIMTHSISTGTDAPGVQQAEAGCNTARVQTSEKMIDTCVTTHETASQARPGVRDMGCDGIITQMQTQASQMEVQVKDVDVTCDLLIPSDDDENDLEEVACIKCNGSQVNKKGLPCRKCNGKGTLVSKELSAVAAVVRQEVQEYCQNTFRQMFLDYLKEKKIKQSEVVHQGIACDGCDAEPIKGIRYKCTVRTDTDFCETCEKNATNGQYPLVKIRKVEQAPAKIICQYKRDLHQTQPAAAQAQAQAQSNDVHPWERNSQPAKVDPKNVRYSARFVKESFPDKYEMLVDTIFCKSWWMRNDGETAWPKGTQFVQTSGDDISAKLVTLKNEVAAGETFEISVQCKSPAQEGRYTAFFRLQTGRIKFGHKVSCDILCVQSGEPVIHDEIVDVDESMHAEPVAMVAQEMVEVIAANDKELAESMVYQEEVKADEPMVDEAVASQPSALLNSSTISIDRPSPKQVYFENVAAEENEVLRTALTSLYDFGFINFNANKVLMLKHKDVNTVANQLLTGALSESQFQGMMQ